jgi:hypothetical protein
MPTTAAHKTLATPFEIKSVSQVSINTNESTFCACIKTQEETLFNTCFGRDFYKDLQADKAVYTYNDFIKNTAYSVGDVVLYFGQLFICTQATTGTAAQEPNNNSYWEAAPKFNNTDYNTLWDGWLLLIIADFVIANSAIGNSIEQTAQGLIRKTGDYFQPATASEISISKKQRVENARATIKNMEVYILENPTHYPSYLLVKKGACGKKSCSSLKTPFGFS